MYTVYPVSQKVLSESLRHNHHKGIDSHTDAFWEDEG